MISKTSTQIQKCSLELPVPTITNYSLGYGQEPPQPKYVYDVESGDKYEKIDDKKEATHWLDKTDGTGIVSLSRCPQRV